MMDVVLCRVIRADPETRSTCAPALPEPRRVHPRPGLTKTMTALVEGGRNRTPKLSVADDTPRADRNHLQNLDQHALVAAAGG